MNSTLKRIVLGVAISALAGTTALAADVMPVMPSPAPVVVVPPAAPGFDFAGAYVGTGAQVVFCTGPCWYNIEAHAGYNVVRGRLFAGLEVGGGYWNEFGGGGWFAEASARAGVVLGRAVGYGRVGYVYYGPIANPSPYITFAGGIEFAVGQSLSIFTEAVAERAVGGGFTAYGVAGGVNFHFGN